VANAYLLAGPAGVGKVRLAMEFAKALICEGESRPCDECRHCLQAARGVHPDVHVLEPGGASQQVKIQDVRTMRDRIALRPFSARAQAAVIIGADRLTEEAANSLLKSIEEPSARAHFVMTTENLTACLPTVVSRCQVLRCHPLPAEAVRRWLIDARGCEPRRAETIARSSQGRLSEAGRLAEAWESDARDQARLAGPDALWLQERMPETRDGLAALLDKMIRWLRDVAATGAAGPEWALDPSQAEAFRRQARRAAPGRCVEAALELVRMHESLERYANPRLVGALARETWLSVMQPTS